jgi:hypothetical protein
MEGEFPLAEDGHRSIVAAMGGGSTAPEWTAPNEQESNKRKQRTAKRKFEIQLISRWDPDVPSLCIHFSASRPWLNERSRTNLFLSTNLTFINSK